MNKTWKKPKYKIMEKIKIIGNREMKSSWFNSKNCKTIHQHTSKAKLSDIE